MSGIKWLEIIGFFLLLIVTTAELLTSEPEPAVVGIRHNLAFFLNSGTLWGFLKSDNGIFWFSYKASE